MPLVALFPALLVKQTLLPRRYIEPVRGLKSPSLFDNPLERPRWEAKESASGGKGREADEEEEGGGEVGEEEER